MIKDFFEHLFTLYPSYAETLHNDPYAIWVNAIGGIMISIPFIIVGLMCIIMAGTDPKYTRRRIVLTKLFGYFIFCCGLSRLIDTYCIWHNYAIIAGYAKNLTGILAWLAIVYTPAVIRETLKIRTLEQVDESLKQTNIKIDKLKELGDKITT